MSATCARDGCKNAAGRKYCSSACANADRQRRHRLRVKGRRWLYDGRLLEVDLSLTRDEHQDDAGYSIAEWCFADDRQRNAAMGYIKFRIPD